MSQSARAQRRATAVDLARLPQDVRAEVIDGVIVEKAAPSYEHSDAQSELVLTLRGTFQRGGPRGPGGWWIVTECEIELEPHEVYRPDLVGWRRERVPERPSGRPVRIVPDWVCEVLSPSNASNDVVLKFRVFQRSGIPFYWIVDPERETLTVHKLTEQGYLVTVQAGRDDVVRAEPFEAIEIQVALLFGGEPPPGETDAQPI